MSNSGGILLILSSIMELEFGKNYQGVLHILLVHVQLFVRLFQKFSFYHVFVFESYYKHLWMSYNFQECLVHCFAKVSIREFFHDNNFQDLFCICNLQIV